MPSQQADGGFVNNMIDRATHAGRAVAAALAVAVLTGCSGMEVATRNSLYATAIATAAVTPSADIEQTYYLGSFDPRDQLPPSIYRVRVRGQSSILNRTRFASSWVPAEVVDALTGSIQIDTGKGSGSGSVRLASDPTAAKTSLEGAGRGLMLFGPEGFREAPRGHRLVVIMGATPEEVEQAFASALGTVAKVKFGRSGASLDKEAFGLLIELGQEREQLKTLAASR